jgi:hypothetical protein
MYVVHAVSILGTTLQNGLHAISKGVFLVLEASNLFRL